MPNEQEPLDRCPLCSHERHDGVRCCDPLSGSVYNRDTVCECEGPLADIDFAPISKPGDVPWKYEAGQTRARMIARDLGYDS